MALILLLEGATIVGLALLAASGGLTVLVVVAILGGWVVGDRLLKTDPWRVPPYLAYLRCRPPSGYIHIRLSVASQDLSRAKQALKEAGFDEVSGGANPSESSKAWVQVTVTRSTKPRLTDGEAVNTTHAALERADIPFQQAGFGHAIIQLRHV